MTLAATLARVDAHWAAALGCHVSDLAQARTLVVRHGPMLSDYAGLFALKRNTSRIISAPPARYAATMALFGRYSPDVAFDADLLQQAVAPQRGTVIGPAWLGYADHTDFRPADNCGTRRLTSQDAALRALQTACDPLEWVHSGIEGGHDLLFGCFLGSLLVGAGTCRRDGDEILDAGIVTHPAYRGQGYGRAVVSAMTAYGLDQRHIMRYRTLCANAPSLRIACALGYQQYGLTIAVRLAG